ncbi:MAG: hypothetical protein HDR07_01450 [Lachnospiraceae bacterium]|nr:hypothetical protein [Lachnospiraceae bacterium]
MRNEDSGFIKIHRKIIEWPWYTDINTCRLFIHMILRANWKEGRFRDTTVPRGSFVSSLDKLSEETLLTKREIRTAISHLKATGEVVVKTTNRYSIFTVKNYDLYQCDDTQRDIEATDRRHSDDILTTLIEEREERKEDLRNIINDISCPEPPKAALYANGISLPLNDKSFFEVPMDKITLWMETYPAVDVEQELRRMIAWLEANPAKRKTRRGIERFINSWLARTQDSGGSKGQKEGDLKHGNKEDSRSFSL